MQATVFRFLQAYSEDSIYPLSYNETSKNLVGVFILVRLPGIYAHAAITVDRKLQPAVSVISYYVFLLLRWLLQPIQYFTESR